MDNSYLFYDLETSGLNPCFDQVMQFAAIRTDLQFNELERHEIFVTLNPDVIASPDAMIIHQVGLDDIVNGDSEWRAIEKIHTLFNTPGTISLGYNTLGFDDEFLRFSFFRNLLPCYTHQYANGCSRMDIYPITALYYLFANDCLHWPIVDDRVSLKLEHLNAQNNLAHGQAHNALVDVEATVALACKLAEKTDMWQYVCGYFNKNTDLTRLNQLPIAFSHQQPYHYALAVNGTLGYRNRFIAPVLHLGQHLHYKNQSLWLRLDNVDFSTVKADSLIEQSFVLKKRAAEPPFILPPKPRFESAVDDERLQLSERNQQFFSENPELIQMLQQHHQHFTFDRVTHADTQAQLYQMDFPSSQDTRLQQQLHRKPVKDWQSLIEQFEQDLYQELAVRIMGRHFPTALNHEQKEQYNDYLKGRFNNEHPPIDFRQQSALTLKQAVERCDELLKTSLSERQRAILDDYKGLLVSYTDLHVCINE